MTYEDLFLAVERAYRTAESTDLEYGEVTLARVVAPSGRGTLFVVTRDSIRSPGHLERLLAKGNDLVVTSRGEPRFVIVDLEEYERLTGRRPEPPEI